MILVCCSISPHFHPVVFRAGFFLSLLLFVYNTLFNVSLFLSSFLAFTALRTWIRLRAHTLSFSFSPFVSLSLSLSFWLHSFALSLSFWLNLNPTFLFIFPIHFYLSALRFGLFFIFKRVYVMHCLSLCYVRHVILKYMIF